jgi:hypothetical protein
MVAHGPYDPYGPSGRGVVAEVANFACEKVPLLAQSNVVPSVSAPLVISTVGRTIRKRAVGRGSNSRGRHFRPPVTIRMF